MTTLKATDITAQYLQELHGNKINTQEWNVDNGTKVTTIRKVTTRNNVVKTNYLHIIIDYPSGNKEYYREQKDGNFKTI